MFSLTSCTKEERPSPEPARNGNNLAGQSGGAAGQDGGGGTGGSPSISCAPGLPGPSMVLIPREEGAFCIDSTEVTRKHYAEFLSAKKDDLKGQSELCKFNQTYKPFVADPNGSHLCKEQENYLAPKKPENPITCVNWCQARAYCAWAGKRLCGRLDGVNMVKTEEELYKDTEWSYVCSQGGTTKFAYGDSIEENRCRWTNELTDTSGDFPVSEKTECRGETTPWNEIMNLGGGAFEWGGSCLDYNNHISCQIHGHVTPERLDSCDNVSLKALNSSRPDLGFRCCANVE